MIIPKWIYDTLAISVGSVSLAVGVALFVLPYQIAAGGSPGVTVLLSQFLDFSPGIILFAVNASLMLLGLHVLGLSFLLRTLVAIALVSGLTDFLIYSMGDFSLTENRLLSAIYAGTFLGLGIGLVFRGGASSGGWAILVRLIADRTQIGVGQVAVLMDGSVVVVAMLVFKDIESGLLGGVTVFITGRMIDWVLTEKPEVNLVNVYSSQAAELQNQIEDRFGIRGTLLVGDSKDQEGSRDMLHLSIDRRDLAALKSTITTWAPDAYLTVASTIDVMGVRPKSS